MRLGLPIALFSAAALIGGSGALAAEADAPLATAQAAAAPPPGDAASSTAAKIHDFISDAGDDGGALDLGADLKPDRKVHGSVDAWVGNHGQRGFAVQAVGPLGQHGSLGLAVSVGHGPGVWAPYGYGGAAYGPLVPAGPLRPAALGPDPNCRQDRTGMGQDPLAGADRARGSDCRACCGPEAP